MRILIPPSFLWKAIISEGKPSFPRKDSWQSNTVISKDILLILRQNYNVKLYFVIYAVGNVFRDRTCQLT